MICLKEEFFNAVLKVKRGICLDNSLRIIKYLLFVITPMLKYLHLTYSNKIIVKYNICNSKSCLEIIELL